MVDLFAYIGGILAMVSFLPQIAKIRRTGSAQDLSFAMLLVTLVGAMAYEIYALLLSLWPVVIMNGLFFLAVLYTVWLKWRLEGRRTMGRDRLDLT